MLVPLVWLNEKFERPLDPLRLPEALMNAGLELEGIQWVRPGLETVVTGKVLSCEAHPNADRLRVCTVDVRGEAPLQVVTAATNVQTNCIVPVALVGSRLPTGKEIAAAKMRGVDSFGMFCSATELGLDPQSPTDTARLVSLLADSRGTAGAVDATLRQQLINEAFEFVLLLPDATLIGRQVAAVLELGDCVLNIAITANRGDCLSVEGLARELAAAGLGTLKSLGPVSGLTRETIAANWPGPRVRVELAATDLCLRYSAQIVTGLKIGPSPSWLARRLELAGTRPINNAVDVMNYVMLDQGQPLHAFDLERLPPADSAAAGNEICISARRSLEHESLVTLDDHERQIAPETLVIAANGRAIAIAGVMGGKDSAVSADTSCVLVESAYFQPASVRRTAKGLTLRSESSYRFERGVDPEGTRSALLNAAILLAELGGGQLAGPVAEAINPELLRPQVVGLRPERVTRILGQTIDPNDQEALLGKIGFARLELSPPERNGLNLSLQAATSLGPTAKFYRVPGWRRHDVTREIDLIEEIGRLYGYANIRSTLPQLDRLARPHRGPAEVMREQLRGFGFFEVLANSLASESSQRPFLAPGQDLVRLNDPLGEMQVLRASLLPGLLQIAGSNLKLGAPGVAVYDLGRTYRQVGQDRYEDAAICALAAGDLATGMWKRAPAVLQAGFEWARGLVDYLLLSLGVSDYSIEAPESPPPGWHPGRSAHVVASGRLVVQFGEVHPRQAEEYDITPGMRVVALLFHPTAIEAALRESPPIKFRPLSRFPAAERDVALVVDRAHRAHDLVTLARATGGDLVEDARVFDCYVGPQIPAGKANLAIALRYRSYERTLSDAEVDSVHQAIVEELCQRFSAKLR